MKEQKTKKEEVSRGSNKALEKVGEEVESLKNVLFNLANNIQQYSALVHKLKHDAAVVRINSSTSTVPYVQQKRKLKNPIKLLKFY